MTTRNIDLYETERRLSTVLVDAWGLAYELAYTGCWLAHVAARALAGAWRGLR